MDPQGCGGELDRIIASHCCISSCSCQVLDYLITDQTDASSSRLVGSRDWGIKGWFPRLVTSWWYDKILDRNRFRKEKVSFGSQFECLVHHGGRHSSRSVRPLVTLNPQSESQERWTLLLIVLCPGPQPVEWLCPYLRWVFPSQLTRSRSSLKGNPQRFGSVVILNPIKLPIKINHQNPGIR